MFCSKCGATLLDNATICSACNTPVAGAASSAASPSGAGASGATAAMNVVKGSGLQALSSLKMIARNPVGALPQAYETLGESGALRVGIVFGVLSVICFLLCGFNMLPDFARHDFFDMLGFGGVMKLILFTFSPFVGLALCSLGARKGFGKAGGLGGDCFISGTALLPMSICALIAPIFGIEHLSVLGGLMVIALCLGVLILFSGYVKVSKLEERWATYAVPAAIIVTMWLSNLLVRSIFSDPPYRSREVEMPDHRRFDSGR